MENASKALIMAASILIGIVIISAFILMMSNLTNYQEKSYQSNLSDQIAEFNNQFTTYARDGIRGSDMISLMNRVVDYNTRYTGTEGYTKMQVTINMNGYNHDLVFEGTNQLVTRNEYNQDNIDEIVGKPSSVTGDITDGKIRDIEKKYEQKYCNQLAAEISNIKSIIQNTRLSSTQKDKAFDDEEILPKPVSSYTGGLNKIYEDAKTYYEYVQFKRTYFNCIGTPEYDSNTGRIIKLEFECTGVGV